jgi:hypothetical protein
LKELAQEAIRVQDACNLSGVVHGWHRAMEDLFSVLRGPPHNLGTDGVNTHPINQLWASKCHDLARMGLSDCEAYGKAYRLCIELAEDEDEGS